MKIVEETSVETSVETSAEVSAETSTSWSGFLDTAQNNIKLYHVSYLSSISNYNDIIQGNIDQLLSIAIYNKIKSEI